MYVFDDNRNCKHDNYTIILKSMYRHQDLFSAFRACRRDRPSGEANTRCVQRCNKLNIKAGGGGEGFSSEKPFPAPSPQVMDQGHLTLPEGASRNVARPFPPCFEEISNVKARIQLGASHLYLRLVGSTKLFCLTFHVVSRGR